MEKRHKFFRPTTVVLSAMAKSNNLPAKIYKAGERTETTLRFCWDAGADGGTVYLDIAKALSIVNRRAYRQGLMYYVASASFSNGTTAYCQVNTIPDNYMTKVAWIRGFKKWSEMNRRASDGEGGSIYPKYHDFKVLMNSGAGSTLNPCYGFLGSTTAWTADDWVISEFVTEDPYLHGGGASDTPVEAHNADQFTAHMMGAHTGSSGAWTSIGLIHSAQDTWAFNAATEPVLLGDMDTDPISNLFDSGDTHDDVRLNLDEDNDAAPYNYDFFIGGASAHETAIGAIMRVSAGAGALARAPGFPVPLGLLEVTTSDFGDGSQSIDQVELILELVPGTYNGVYAERYL